MRTNASLRSLSDPDLLTQFGDLVRGDAKQLGALLRHIDEIDRRQLWAKAGFPSMFAFCVERYHFSDSMAGKRIAVARIARRYPMMFDMIARGELHLSGIMCLRKHLTDDNHAEVLAEAKRAVWLRDEGRCAFVAKDGTRCNSTWRVEFGHIEAYARGGAHSVENIALRCDAHNDYEANRDYGELFMSSKRGDVDRVHEPRASYRAA